MRRAVVFALVAAVACRAPYRPPTGKTTYGPYAFKNVLPNANPPLTLEGTVLVLPDTVILTLGRKSCSPGFKAAQGAFTYNCGEFSFVLNRENPLHSNSYRVPTMIWRTRRVCESYRPNAAGGEVCQRYRNERYESREVIAGSLSFVAPR